MAAFTGVGTKLPVNATRFFAEYHGHPTEDLRALIATLRQRSSGIVWLAGDSSLDNKHWLYGGRSKHDSRHLADERLAADACGAYAELLAPSRMVRDVSFWLNQELDLPRTGLCCVNTAVEASTLSDRSTRLTQHDVIIRDNLLSEDVVVVSVGGNDVALRPSSTTQACLALLLASQEGTQEHTLALDHFVSMFKHQIEDYIKKLLGNPDKPVGQVPRLVVVCMVYFFDEVPGGSWCEGVLSKMGYNSNPGVVQHLIRRVFQLATANVEVRGTKIVPLALFDALDGKDTRDYCQRVEPSVSGGQKIARAIAKAIAAEGAEERQALPKTEPKDRRRTPSQRKQPRSPIAMEGEGKKQLCSFLF